MITAHVSPTLVCDVVCVSLIGHTPPTSDRPWVIAMFLTPIAHVAGGGKTLAPGDSDRVRPERKFHRTP
jgi:hypothetical protein